MPKTFTQQQRQDLLSALKKGRYNAIGAVSLAQQLGFSTSSNQVKLRTLIKECIEHDGDLIGAVTSEPAGFFEIATLSELEQYIDSLEHRTRRDNDRRSALIKNWNINNQAQQTTKQRLSIQ
ncbi:MAG: hypothetical protein P0Y53_09975 [Candidatus Pseudobacter hemicellulosilyticus]|uniref:Uncharacterized protein n=1 Tax=Candidatus Pseudobacter hemicellulosilyticus TaxID=3121375 RepID=A0AAJ5WX50_9BACT|nr:MAG: hypothetical protein P0Y53_09975 [Pseudobacter sp.]